MRVYARLQPSDQVDGWFQPPHYADSPIPPHLAFPKVYSAVATAFLPYTLHRALQSSLFSFAITIRHDEDRNHPHTFLNRLQSPIQTAFVTPMELNQSFGDYA